MQPITVTLRDLVITTLRHHRIKTRRGTINRIVKCAKRSWHKGQEVTIAATKFAIQREIRRA